MGRNKESKKFRVSNKEMELIASTPPNECYLCKLLLKIIIRDKKGLYFFKDELETEELTEHLEQIIKRNIGA